MTWFTTARPERWTTKIIWGQWIAINLKSGRSESANHGRLCEVEMVSSLKIIFKYSKISKTMSEDTQRTVILMANRRSCQWTKTKLLSQLTVVRLFRRTNQILLLGLVRGVELKLELRSQRREIAQWDCTVLYSGQMTEASIDWIVQNLAIERSAGRPENFCFKRCCGDDGSHWWESERHSEAGKK